jgi:hypothetical protein
MQLSHGNRKRKRGMSGEIPRLRVGLVYSFLPLALIAPRSKQTRFIETTLRCQVCPKNSGFDLFAQRTTTF